MFPNQDPEPDEPLSCQSEESGSIIGCQNQTLGEAVGVVGTPFGLHYQSDRTPGSKAAYSLEIPLSGAQVPDSLMRIELVVFIAGQIHTMSFPAATNLRTTFVWDGKDAYGRTLQGVQPIGGLIGYTYRGVYGTTSRFGYSAVGITGSLGRADLTLWRTWHSKVGGWDARAAGLGGWTLSAHHTYDVAGQIMYRGDGDRQSGTTLGPIITTFAGTGTAQSGCFGGDGGPAKDAVVCPRGLAVGPDGSLNIAGDLASPRIRRVGPDGIITTVAGTGIACSPSTDACGDSGPATQARFVYPRSVAVGADGSLYIADSENRRVRRVGPDGIIMTVAGNGNLCPSPTSLCGDGGSATLATVAPHAVALGPDGSVYIGDLNTRRVRRVTPDGIITTVAGTGGTCFPTTGACGDGGPAALATLFTPDSLAVGRDGSLYIGDSSVNRLRRVDPNGIISTIAGTGATGFSGDGGPAIQATFRSISAIAVGPDENIYLIDRGNNRVRWLRLGGTINTLAGNGASATTGDGGPAARAALRNAQEGLAVAPDGSVYVSQVNDLLPEPRIRRISQGTQGLPFHGTLAASEDGREVYLFGPGGRHLRTVDALTGAMLLEFSYDAAGLLSGVTDGDGNVTVIERDGAGRATAIIGAFGHRTPLATNADGYLERISTPTAETVRVGYTAAGLLTAFTDARGHGSLYDYDTAGRLIGATDRTGASKTLTRVGTSRDYTVAVTNSLGQTTTYRVERLATGALRSTTTSAAAAQMQTVIGMNGTHSVTLPGGATIDLVLGPDPRWGMQAPVATSLTMRTPGGRLQTTTQQRTVTLATPDDLFSVRTFTDTTAVNGRVSINAYDASTRTVTHTSPAGRRDRVVLDARGRTVQVQLADLSPTVYTYDARGRVETTVRGDGDGSRVMRFAYGPDGFLATVTDPTSRVTAFTYDASGRILTHALPGGRVIGFAYDPNGNVAAITAPSGTAHTFTYTERDQASAYLAPPVGEENSQTRFAYGADGQPVRIDRPDGNAVGLQYDAAGRLTVIDLTADDRSYAYDLASRLGTLGTSALSLAFAYDASLLTGTTWSGAVSGSVSRTHDNDFRLASRSVNGGTAIVFQYDNDGLLTGAGSLTLNRNPENGLITGTTLGNVTHASGYNSFGELTSSSAAFSGSNVYNALYTRDELGRVTQKRETIGGVTDTFDFFYDLAGRLSEVRRNGTVTATYTYDANGNRLTGPPGATTYTYDVQDRLVGMDRAPGAATVSYTYTSGGDLLTKTVSGQTTTYRYDALGNIVNVTLPTGVRIDYVIDGLNRRIGKTVDGTLVQRYLYADGLKPIAELDADDNVVSRFVYATGINVPAYIIRGGSTYRLITDHLGSPRLVVDVATGAVAQRLDYDEFGNVMLDTNPGFQPFGFAGGLYDADAKLVRFGARDYDAETGRWTAKDPGGFVSGPNLYIYADNDPVNLIDPRGDNPGKASLEERTGDVRHRSDPRMQSDLNKAMTQHAPEPRGPARPATPGPSPGPTPQPSPAPPTSYPPASQPLYSPPQPKAGTGTALVRRSFLGTASRCFGRFLFRAAEVAGPLGLVLEGLLSEPPDELRKCVREYSHISDPTLFKHGVEFCLNNPAN